MLAGAAWQFVVLILVLGIVVVFHELGHFLAAKLVGVRVEVFSFGFGRRLFGRRVGDTDYRVSLIPLGGYVRMAGEGSEEGRSGARDEFESRSTPEKLLIMGMGPIFNIVLAVAFMTAAYMIGFQTPAYLEEPVVVEHVQPDSPAAEAGIALGDRIVAVDGRPVATWSDLQDLVLVRPGADSELRVVRGGAEMTVPVMIAARTKHEIGWLGVHPCHAVVVDSVREGGPADRAGVRAGDVIARIGAQPVCTVDNLVQTIEEAEGAELDLVLERDGGRVALSVAAELDPAEDRWLIGIGPGLRATSTVTQRHGLGAAFLASIEQNLYWSKFVLTTVGRLVTGQMSLRSTSGPLELADIAAATAETGLVPFLQLMSLVSVNLGILNLLPIPVLDGGRIAILLIEGLRGRELAPRTKDWILQAGVVMILALMGLVLFFDILKKLT